MRGRRAALRGRGDERAGEGEWTRRCGGAGAGRARGRSRLCPKFAPPRFLNWRPPFSCTRPCMPVRLSPASGGGTRRAASAAWRGAADAGGASGRGQPEGPRGAASMLRADMAAKWRAVPGKERRGQEPCQRPRARARERRRGGPSMRVRRIRLGGGAGTGLGERDGGTRRDLAGPCRGPEPRRRVRRDVPDPLQRRKGARENRLDAPRGGGRGLPWALRQAARPRTEAADCRNAVKKLGAIKSAEESTPPQSGL